MTNYDSKHYTPMTSHEWFFHGQHQPRRIVSHKSKREPESAISTKESLLAYAQKERQSRQLINQQKQSTILIQVYFKRYLSKKIFSNICINELENISIKSSVDWDRALFLFFWVKSFYISDNQSLKYAVNITIKALTLALSNSTINHSELSIINTVLFIEYCSSIWTEYSRDLINIYELFKSIDQLSSAFKFEILKSKIICNMFQYNGLIYQNWYMNDFLIPTFYSIKSNVTDISYIKLLLDRFHSSMSQSEDTFRYCLNNNYIIDFYSNLLYSNIKCPINNLEVFDSASSRRISLFLFYFISNDNILLDQTIEFIIELQLSLLNAFKNKDSLNHTKKLHELLGQGFSIICKIITLYTGLSRNTSLLKFLLCIYFIMEHPITVEYITMLLMIDPKHPLPLLITWSISSMNEHDPTLIALFLCILLQQYLIIITDSEVQEKFGSFLNTFCIYSSSKIIDLVEKPHVSYEWFGIIRIIDAISITSQFLWKIYFVNQRIKPNPGYLMQIPESLTKYINTIKKVSFQASLLDKMNRYVDALLDNDIEKEYLILENKDSELEGLLMILFFIPFIIPFDLRAHLLQRFINQDKNRHASLRDWFNPPLSINVRRGFEFEDGYKQLFRMGLHGRIQVTFLDELGIVESGIDGGSLFKEFITRIFQNVFHPNFELFRIVGQDNTLCPVCNLSAIEPSSLFHYEFIGSLVGKALYEDILLDARFSLLFLKKWRGFNGSLEDLRLLDQDLYKNLLFLKDCSDVESLNLTFTTFIPGSKNLRELIPNGKNVTVTNENRFKYIYALAHDILNTQLEVQTRSFLRGFNELIQPIWMRLFAPDEIQILVSGNQKDIDWKDWKNHTVYNGYKGDQDIIIFNFWSVVKEMSQEDLSLLLLFSTGCSRPPLFGFQELHPNFCISRSGFTDSVDQRLPTVSACNNMLHLPDYSERSILKERLLYAIQSNTGFYLA